MRHIIPIALLTFSSAAIAQEEEGTEGSPRVQYKARTEIDFEGVNVAGEMIKPMGSLLLDRKRASFNPLIKIRTDFDEEMDQSVNAVK